MSAHEAHDAPVCGVSAVDDISAASSNTSVLTADEIKALLLKVVKGKYVPSETALANAVKNVPPGMAMNDWASTESACA